MQWVCGSPFQQYKKDLLVGAEVFDGGASRPNLPPQDVVKDLTHILLPLKTHMKLNTQVLLCPSVLHPFSFTSITEVPVYTFLFILHSMEIS